ncbi:MAG: ribosome hibernation promotion factor [Pseudonocardiaceae bacterium]
MWTTETPEVQVSVEGLPAAMADYAREKVSALLGQTHQPVLFARVRLTRHGNPALERPIVAQGNLDVNGRLVRAQVAAPTMTEAVDALEARLRSRLERTAEHWEARRGRRYHADPHEWRHGDPASEWQPWFPRPGEERQIVRHKSFTLPRCTVDEAAAEMIELDYDFHLFTEQGSGQDSVLYRAGPTGYRLAQLVPQPDLVTAGKLPLTISEQPAPLLSTDEAIQRLNLTGLPFVFYCDGDHARGRLLYLRYDGHYGLITPAS